MTRTLSLLVLATALLLGTTLLATAEAQRPGGDRRGPGRRSLLGLLRSEQVQKELKLTDDQTAKVKEIGEKLREEMSSQWSGVREMEDRDARRAKMTELTKQMDEKSREGLRDVISWEQLMRLYQIRLQIRGSVYGLNHEWIANRLQLTSEQKDKLSEIKKSNEQTMREAFSSFRDLSQEERREKMGEFRKIRTDADEQALGVLTDEQKTTYEQLKGEKFEFERRRG